MDYWGGVWREGGLRFATLHHHEVTPVQAEAKGGAHRNDLPGCSAIVSAREKQANGA